MRAVAIALVAVAAGGGPLTAARVTAADDEHTKPKPVTVELGEFFFRPKTVHVRVGQSVRFVNVGKIDHTVSGGPIKPRPLGHGDVQTVVFHRAGTIKYICTFHPTLMRGRVIVTR